MIVLINTFIVVYLLFAWSWNLPDDRFGKRVLRRLSPVVRWSGLWHSWSMFAPSPILVERRMAVELTYDDDSVDIHDLYRIHEAGKLAAFLNVRERKYQAVMAKKGEKVHRPAVCRYVTDHLADPEKKVVLTELVVAKRRIRKPGVTEENEVERAVLWKINQS